MTPVSRETQRAIIAGLGSAIILGALILLGSRNLSHFDPALVGYTFGTLFAAFAITYRYAIWLQRPPTAVYWRRGWQLAFQLKRLPKNILLLFNRIFTIMALNSFIWKRDLKRGAAHWMMMWGCVIAALITFPLVFGWLYFESAPDSLDHYRLVIFGFPTFAFPVGSGFAALVFHGLVLASILVIGGMMLAMRRRMRDRDAAVLQTFGDDFLPLILLFAISMTGLMLTVSYTWLSGYAYEFLAILHAIIVVFTLIWLPFGKFFHLFQRPAQLGVGFYKDLAREEEPWRCARCGSPFAQRMHVEDLIEVQRKLGYRYELKEHSAAHYQNICPHCRRMILGIAQGLPWRAERLLSEEERQVA